MKTVESEFIRKIDTNCLPLGYYFRDRSGYEGSAYMVQGDGNCSISAKSNEYKQNRMNGVEKFPIVLMKSMDLIRLVETSEGFEATYRPYGEVNRRSIFSLLHWYQRHGINGENIQYNFDQITLKGLKFDDDNNKCYDQAQAETHGY